MSEPDNTFILQQRIEQLEAERDAIQSAWWWRLTAPLRNLRGLFYFLKSRIEFRSSRLKFLTDSGLQLASGSELTSDNTQMYLSGERGFLPCGWTAFKWDVNETLPDRAILYPDCGEGFTETLTFNLDLNTGRQLVLLPRLTRALRLDFDYSQALTLPEISFRCRSNFFVFFDQFFNFLKTSGTRAVLKFIPLLFKADFRALRKELFGDRYPELWKRSDYQREIRRQSEPVQIVGNPIVTFSFILPVYNTPERWLRRTLDCVLAQNFPNWELCIADDASTRPGVRRILESYTQRDPRIKVTFREENGHISVASNTALSMASGDYIVLLDHDDEIPSDALSCLANAITLAEVRPLLIFSDEDRIDSLGRRFQPYFKPGFNRELLLKQNLISHLGCYDILRARAVGGFRSGYEGSQDWDFALRFTAEITDSEVVHIPRVLYHWRMLPSAVSFVKESQTKALLAGQRAVQDFLARSSAAESKVSNGLA